MSNNPQVFAEIISRLKNTRGFEKVFHNLKIMSVGSGNCIAEYKAEQDATNEVKSLHGGFSASLVDSVSTFALYSHDKVRCPTVSIDLTVSFLRKIVVGDEIVIDARTLSVGKRIGFLTVDIYNKATKQLLVKGGHTKFIIRK